MGAPPSSVAVREEVAWGWLAGPNPGKRCAQCGHSLPRAITALAHRALMDSSSTAARAAAAPTRREQLQGREGRARFDGRALAGKRSPSPRVRRLRRSTPWCRRRRTRERRATRVDGLGHVGERGEARGERPVPVHAGTEAAGMEVAVGPQSAPLEKSAKLGCSKPRSGAGRARPSIRACRLAAFTSWIGWAR